jgi:hypothetical protein
MKTLNLAIGVTLLLLFGNVCAAQSSYVEGVSEIINAGTSSTQIEVYSETFETADIAQYYEAYVEGYLYQNGTVISDGYALGSPYYNDAYGYQTKPLQVPDTYKIQSNHYLVAYYTYYDASTGTTYYDNPDYFTDGGSSGGSNDFLPGSSSCGCYYETADYILLGSTAVQMSSAPPAISGISPTGVSLGTSGTLTVSGTNLVDVFTQTATATISASGITWSLGSQTATQVTINYSVSTSATTGSRTLTLSDRFGSGSKTFNVGDATPQVTSVSPGTWNAGATTRVTFGGKYFGTAPTLSFSSSQVTATIVSGADTQIVANVAVAAAAPDQTVTVTVTSHGYNGSGFLQSNGNSAADTDSASVYAIRAPQPKIMRNGSDITGTSGIAVVTGQQIALTTSAALHSGLVITGNSWTVAGTDVGGYTPKAATPPTLGPPTGNITVTTYTNPSITFFWVYPGQALAAKYHYCMNNNQCSTDVQAAFNVSGVTSGLLAATTPNSDVKINTFVDGCVGDANYNKTLKWINLGQVTAEGGTYPSCGYTIPSPGISFTASGTQPGSGAWQFVQVILTNSIYTVTNTTTQTSSCGIGLDNYYPYPKFPSTSTTTTQDSPGIQINPVTLPSGQTLTELKRSFTAKMYLMWKSSTANSIPVPIGYRQWNYIGDGLRSSSGSWSLGSATNWSSGTFVAAAATQNFNGYPTWNTLDSNGPCTSYNIPTTD